ncbi:LysR family transcriptional regulator [Saccharopolyspora sp. CA-218241]|uniref:LysR family transcriptional regulator n=1 Tax=Saccharopolyspora sp. CA-218241 TaxID=3240027 RepID=UPI003D982DC5
MNAAGGIRVGDTTEPSIQQLRMFLLLAEELHFGRAARRGYISQPALSRHIRTLERNLGVQLIDRTTRAVALTPAGQDLREPARAVVEATAELRARAQHAAAAGVGDLVVGSLDALTSIEPASSILDALRHRLPGVNVQIQRAGFDIATVLLEGLVDAAFLILPVPDGVQYVAVDSGPRCAVLSVTDPLADREVITLADLADHTHIGWSPRVPEVYRNYWACDPRPDGSPVRYSSHQAVDYESSLLAIVRGEGIQLPPAIAEQLYPRPGAVYVEVADVPPWSMALAWLPSKRDHPHVAALRQATHQVLGHR